MWIYTDFDDPHHVQIKEREEFKKNRNYLGIAF